MSASSGLAGSGPVERRRAASPGATLRPAPGAVPVEGLARLARSLRAGGVRVGPSDVVDAVRAWRWIDAADRDEVARAVRIALKVPREAWPAFHAAFDALWAGEEPPAPPTRAPRPWPSGESRARPADPKGVVTRPARAAEPEREVPEGDTPGYTAEALLRRKPFGEWTEADLRTMEAVLARLSRRLATRRGRRLVPTRGRGRIDLRRSFRRSLATGGEVLDPARRRRPIDKPDLAVLCDTSGSMDPHARFLVAFVLALRRAVDGCEVYAFNTGLTRLTPWVGPGDLARALDRVAEAVPDWSGGTRIGECLAEFAASGRIGPTTVVVILSDGLDLGEPETLETAMRSIHRRAREVVWLNPLLADPDYEPTARGMAAALPFVDRFGPAHDLASLERLIPRLRD